MADAPAPTYSPLPLAGDISALQPKELPTSHARYDRQASAGLNTAGGQINLTYGPRELRGQNAMRIYSEMGDDSTVGVLLFLVQNIIRNVRWFVRENSTSSEDIDNRKFVESCLDDMDQPFDEFVSSCLTMCQYGFAPHETVYKKRLGKNPPDRHDAPSNYTDEKIGWATFQLIGQETIQRWEFDETNQVAAVWQLAAPNFKQVRIDQSRLFNVRTSNLFDNPQGLSPLRRAYGPWRSKTNLERIEEIAIERDFCGIAVVHVSDELLRLANQVPNEYNATEVANAKKLVASFATIARDVKTNEQQGILFPMAYDANGNPLFKLEILGSPGTRTVDIGKTIERRKNEIWGVLLADFLGLGQGSSVGSYAMHGDKSALFLMAMRTYLRIICEAFNRIAIPRLFELNGIEADGFPEIDHTPLDRVDITQLGAALQAFAAAGMPIFPNQNIEQRIYEILGLPAPANESEGDATEALAVGADDEPVEVHEVFQGDTVHPDGTIEVPLEHRPPVTQQPPNPDQKLAQQAQVPQPSFARTTTR